MAEDGRTPKQVNREIAEALGWVTVQPTDDGVLSGIPPAALSRRMVPDWYHSLDAQARDVWPVLLAAGWVHETFAYGEEFRCEWGQNPHQIECFAGEGATLAAACAEASLAALRAMKEGANVEH